MKRGKGSLVKCFELICFITLIIVLIANVSLADATVLYSNSSSFIKDKYISGEKISGWINISLDNEDYNSYLYDNFGNKIKFIELVLNNSINYSCSPTNCQSLYYTNNSNGTGSEIRKLVKLSTGFNRINLDNAGFLVPLAGGSYNWSLFLNGNKIVTKKLFIEEKSDIIWGMYPESVSALSDNSFVILLKPEKENSDLSFSWNFGDGSPTQVVKEKTLVHNYISTGNYTIQIKVLEDNKEIGTYSIIIRVKSPKEAIIPKIKDYKDKLVTLKYQINAFPEKYRKIINEKIEFDSLETDLNKIEQIYLKEIKSSSTPDGDYVEIMSSLNNMKIPKSIQPSESFIGLFISEKENINPLVISEMFDESYEEENDETYITGIYKWDFENLAAQINYRVINAYYENSQEELLSDYQINIDSLTNDNIYPVYLVINEDKSRIIFDGDYDLSNSEGKIGIKLSDLNTKSIKFAVEGRITPEEMQMFLSPSLDKINVENKPIKPVEKENNSWSIFLIGIFILAVFFVIGYLFLQKWYAKNYEKSLFKDSTQLYNLTAFVNNAKRQGIKDEEIIKKLKTQKWNGEQIKYVLNKAEGKNTGLPEIPIKLSRGKKNIPKPPQKRVF